MFTIGNYLYRIKPTTKKVSKQHLKFGDTDKFCYEDLYIGNGYYYVRNKNQKVIYTVLNGKDHSRQIDKLINPCTIFMHNDYLVCRLYSLSTSYIFRDNKLDTLALNDKYTQILIHPNNRCVVVVYGTIEPLNGIINKSSNMHNMDKVSIFDSIENFINKNVPKYNIIKFNQYGYCYWLNGQLVAILQGDLNYVCAFNFYNLELKLVHTVDNFKHKFTLNNLSVSGNKIYAWNERHIMIYIDHVVWIKNRIGITIYNQYHDIFLNNKGHMFQIINYVIVPFCFQYDIWRDVDPPVMIINCIDVLIELELFPAEICNIVYKLVIMCCQF